MFQKRIRPAVLPTVLFLLGLGLGGYAMHIKTQHDAYVESIAMLLREEMTTFEFLADGRADVVQRLTRNSFNGLFCQGTYLASLPFVKVTESAVEVLERADAFRREALHKYESYADQELRCEFGGAGGSDALQRTVESNT